MTKQIISTLKVTTLALVLSFGLSYTLAAVLPPSSWNPPTATPPNGNVDTPINVGSTDQTKVGADICTTVLGVTKCLQTAGGSSATGTVNYLPKWKTSSTFGDSMIFDNGTNVGIGTAVPSYKLDVNGTLNAVGGINTRGGATSYSGIGQSGASNALSTTDLDYNRAGANSILRINHHTGISMSAHAAYGGIRFYNQGYNASNPNPYDSTIGGQQVMSINNGAVYTTDVYSSVAGKWMSSGLSCVTKSVASGAPVTISCDAGYTMTGGGCIWRSDGNDAYVYSIPNGNGWYCADYDGILNSAYVRCCK